VKIARWNHVSVMKIWDEEIDLDFEQIPIPQIFCVNRFSRTFSTSKKSRKHSADWKIEKKSL
jgi:hypothetical protein